MEKQYFCSNKQEGAFCGAQMVCEKTGMDVMVDEHYTYRGDMFKCPKCGTMIVAANTLGTDHKTPVVKNQWTVQAK